MQTFAEILDLESLTWSAGPESPGGLDVRKAAVVPFNNTVLLIGGTNQVKSIYQFDLANMVWIPRTEELEYKRVGHAVFDVTGLGIEC